MAKKVTVDFSGVKDQSGINPKHVEEGDYAATLISVKDDPSKDGTPMLCFVLQMDDLKSATYPYYCKLQENQLWKLRNLILATGMKAPKARMSFDPDRLLNKKLAMTLEDDEYEGKMKSVISAVFPVSELADGPKPVEAAEDDDDDVMIDDAVEDVEEPVEAPEDVEEDDEEEDDDAPDGDRFDAMDRTALKRALKKLDPEASVKRNETDDDIRTRCRALEATEEEPEVEEDEEEEIEPDDSIDLDNL